MVKVAIARVELTEAIIPADRRTAESIGLSTINIPPLRPIASVLFFLCAFIYQPPAANVPPFYIPIITPI